MISMDNLDRLREETNALLSLLNTATPESRPWETVIRIRASAIASILGIGHRELWADSPTKPEDAFEVWLCRYFPGVRNSDGSGRLITGLEDEVKAAFLAGAEFGAAAVDQPLRGFKYEIHGPAGGVVNSEEASGRVSSERPGEVLGGSASPVAADTLYDLDVSKLRQYEIPPVGDAQECGEINPNQAPPLPKASGGYFDEKCFFLKGHALSHSWEYKDSCLAFRSGTDLAVRVFCAYKKWHPGKHSWEEGHHATHVVIDEAANPRGIPHSSTLQAEIWNNANSGRFANPDMGYSRERYFDVPTRKSWRGARASLLAEKIHWAIRDCGPDGTAQLGSGDNLDPVGDWINELRELWETM